MFGVVIALGVVAFVSLTREPRADGRSLNEWLRIGHLRWATGGNAGEDGDEVAAGNALRKIGKDGVPMLLAKLGATDPKWKRPLWDGLRQKISWSLPFHFAEEEHSEALYGFSVLGSNAFLAIPELGKALLATNNTVNSASALGHIGRDSVPVLKLALTNADSRIRSAALIGIETSEEVTRECIPEITDRIADADLKVAVNALRRLIRFLPPAQSMALITNALRDPRSTIQRVALRGIARAETNRTETGLAVVPLLEGPDQVLRRMATNVLKRIDPALAFANGIDTNPPPLATNFFGRGGRRRGSPGARSGAP